MPSIHIHTLDKHEIPSRLRILHHMPPAAAAGIKGISSTSVDHHPLLLPLDPVRRAGEPDGVLRGLGVEGAVVHAEVVVGVLHHRRPCIEKVVPLPLLPDVEHGSAVMISFQPRPVDAVEAQAQPDPHAKTLDGHTLWDLLPSHLDTTNVHLLLVTSKEIHELNGPLPISRPSDLVCLDALHIPYPHVRGVEPPPLLLVRRQDRSEILVPVHSLPVHAVGRLSQADPARRLAEDIVPKVQVSSMVPHPPVLAVFVLVPLHDWVCESGGIETILPARAQHEPLAGGDRPPRGAGSLACPRNKSRTVSVAGTRGTD
mmetsp:Transcript_4142/g.15252  ORF Transcript_4142/g.15252 Transcript_4142/m.15252 type:complete len:314 (-) Transcript_4142:343-1284(-)